MSPHQADRTAAWTGTVLPSSLRRRRGPFSSCTVRKGKVTYCLEQLHHTPLDSDDVRGRGRCVFGEIGNTHTS